MSERTRLESIDDFSRVLADTFAANAQDAADAIDHVCKEIHGSIDRAFQEAAEKNGGPH